MTIKEEIKFTVIIATIGRASYSIAKDSVLKQNYSRWELITVFDGIEKDIIINNEKEDSNREKTVVISKRCNNYGDTPKNMAWSLATGDYILYLDDDNKYIRNDLFSRLNEYILSCDSHPLWIVFPIKRLGVRFFEKPARKYSTDGGQICHKRQYKGKDIRWINTSLGRMTTCSDALFMEEVLYKLSEPMYLDSNVEYMEINNISGGRQ